MHTNVTTENLCRILAQEAVKPKAAAKLTLAAADNGQKETLLAMTYSRRGLRPNYHRR
jgi:hypothetical protein